MRFAVLAPWQRAAGKQTQPISSSPSDLSAEGKAKLKPSHPAFYSPWLSSLESRGLSSVVRSGHKSGLHQALKLIYLLPDASLFLVHLLELLITHKELIWDSLSPGMVPAGSCAGCPSSGGDFFFFLIPESPASSQTRGKGVESFLCWDFGFGAAWWGGLQGFPFILGLQWGRGCSTSPCEQHFHPNSGTKVVHLTHPCLLGKWLLKIFIFWMRAAHPPCTHTQTTSSRISSSNS